MTLLTRLPRNGDFMQADDQEDENLYLLSRYFEYQQLERIRESKQLESSMKKLVKKVDRGAEKIIQQENRPKSARPIDAQDQKVIEAHKQQMQQIFSKGYLPTAREEHKIPIGPYFRGVE